MRIILIKSSHCFKLKNGICYIFIFNMIMFIWKLRIMKNFYTFNNFQKNFFFSFGVKAGKGFLSTKQFFFEGDLMLEDSYKSFKQEITARNNRLSKANEKRKTKSSLPIMSSLDEWLAQRHEKKAKVHEEKAFSHAQKHAKGLKKKHKI